METITKIDLFSSSGSKYDTKEALKLRTTATNRELTKEGF